MTHPDLPVMLAEDESLGVSRENRLPPAEIVNAITHGFGLVLSIVGSIALIHGAILQGDVWRILGCSIFSISLIAVYAASTLSHCFSEPRLRNLWRILDQGFIYLLIVGTYTPFSLVYLRTAGWWVFLAIMWAIALIGFCSKVVFSHRVEGVAVWTYVLLGWMPILPVSAMIGIVPAAALWGMLAGGLCYTIGAIFLICDIERLHFHAIWHTLVIAGSTCHFFVILLFIANPPIAIAWS